MLARTTAAALLLVAGQALAQQTQPRDPATRPAQPGERRDMQQPRDDQSRAMPQDRQNAQARKVMTLVPGEWIIKADVRSASNREDLGDVSDLVLSAADGRIEYAIISRGGVLGVGGKKIAVPWESFTFAPGDRDLILNYSASQLDNAPEFKDDQWAMIGDRSWRDRISGFFGGGAAGDSDRTFDDSWLAQGPYQNLVEQGQRATIRGTVKSVDNKSPGGDLGEGSIVTITDQNGQDRIVHLGPSWFVKNQRTILRTGDTVEVQGTEFTFDGRDVIAARTISGPAGTFQFRDEQGRPVWDAAASGRRTAQGQPGEQPGRDAAAPGPAGEPDRPRDRILGTTEPRAGGTFLKGSDIRGMNIETADGTNAGEIKDFVFDAASGRMAYLVVGFGGFLGIGDERVAVPWSAFTVNADGELVLKQADKQQLQAAPRIPDNDWNVLNDPAFAPRVFRHYGIDASWLERNTPGNMAPDRPNR